MKKLQKILFITVGLFVFSNNVTIAAEVTPDPCPNSGTFGCFEVGLPGIESKSIDSFLDTKTPILKFTELAVRVIVGLLVIIGVISIVIGGYLYMTAGGNGKQVETAKEMILAALIGIVIALVSVVILNTINKYLGSSAQEPTLSPQPGAGAPGGGPSGGNPASNPNGPNFPISTTITHGSVQTVANNAKAAMDGFFLRPDRFTEQARIDLQQDIDTIRNQANQLPQTTDVERVHVTDLIDSANDLQARLNLLSGNPP